MAIKKTLNEAIDNLRAIADDTEKNCAEWIKHNPHVALLYALHAHKMHWYGCKCVLDFMDYDGLAASLISRTEVR